MREIFGGKCPLFVFYRAKIADVYLRERRDAAAARETEAVDPVAGGRGQGVRAPRLLHYTHIRPLRQRHQDTRAHVTLHAQNNIKRFNLFKKNFRPSKW